MKRQPTLAQQIKKELKIAFPELKVGCKQKDVYATTVGIYNLHSTSYTLSEIKQYCEKHQDSVTYVFVKNEVPQDKLNELKQMFVTYLKQANAPYDFDLNDFDRCISRLYGCHKNLWYQLLDNEAYEEVIIKESVKPQEEIKETKETNPVISPEPEVIEVETEVNPVPTQQEIKNEITLIEVEIEKLTELIDYLDNNDIGGNIYDTTQEELDNLCQQLNELRMKLDPTAEIKAQIEANQRELKKLSVILTQAISELNILKVSQIQQEITNTVKEIEILQDKLNGNSNVVRLFG